MGSGHCSPHFRCQGDMNIVMQGFGNENCMPLRTSQAASQLRNQMEPDGLEMMHKHYILMLEFPGSSNGRFFGGLLSQLAAGFFFFRHGATARRRRQQLRRPWPRSSAAGELGNWTDTNCSAPSTPKF